MNTGRSVRMHKAAAVIRRARTKVQNIVFAGDSKNGCLEIDITFSGERDIWIRGTMDKIANCPGGLWVAPVDNGGWLTARPGTFPVYTSTSNLTANRRLGREITEVANYAAYDTAPTADYGDASPAGEDKASDLPPIIEFMIPQKTDGWPTNGTGGIIMRGRTGSSAVIRSAMVFVQNKAQWSYTESGHRFGYMWKWIPGTSSQINALSSATYYFVRRQIPTGAGGTEYDTAFIPVQCQSYNGTGANIAETSPGSGIWSLSTDVTGANWTNYGSVFGNTNPGAVTAFTPTVPGACFGIANHSSGGDFNDAQTARALAYPAANFMFSNQVAGLRTAVLTRGGFKADTLNDSAHDGTAADPQRMLLEACNAHALVLSFGSNDIGASVAADDFASEITTFYDRVMTYRPTMPVIVNMYYAGNVGGSQRTLLMSYGDAIRRTAQSRPMLVIKEHCVKSMGDALSTYSTSHLAITLGSKDVSADRYARDIVRQLRHDGKRHGRHRHAA